MSTQFDFTGFPTFPSLESEDVNGCSKAQYRKYVVSKFVQHKEDSGFNKQKMKEACLLKANKNKIILYYRYVDDILAVTTSCFVNSLKSRLSEIWVPLKLEFECNLNSVNFLDLTIFRDLMEWNRPTKDTLTLRLHTKLFQAKKPLPLFALV